MRICSSEIKGPVTFMVGEWKTDMETFNLDLHFSYADEDEEEEEAQELQNAAMDEAHQLRSEGDAAHGEKRDFHTPSNDVIVLDRHPQTINPASNKARQPRSTPSPNDPEYSKRTYVLEVLRRNKLTRRELARRAGVDDFRAMNYWLRGKDMDTTAVVESGKLIYDWAKQMKKTSASSSRVGKSPFEEGDEQDGEEGEEEEEEEDLEASPMSSSKRLCLTQTKRRKAQTDKSSQMSQPSYGSPEPFLLLKTPVLEKRRASSSLPTPLPLHSPVPVHHVGFTTSNLGRTGGLNSPLNLSFSALNTPVRFFSSPTRPHQTPSLMDMSTSSTIRTRLDEEHSPEQSPFTSPTRMFETLFSGEKMLDATPGLTPSFGRTQQLDSERAKRRLFE